MLPLQVESLLGNVGGIMGLYIGASLFSVVEIIVFIVSLIRLGFRRLLDKMKIRPTQVPA